METVPFALAAQRVETPSWLLHCDDDEGALDLDVVGEMTTTGFDRWSIAFPPELPTPTVTLYGLPTLQLATPGVTDDNVAHCLVVFAADTWQVQSVDVEVDAAQDLTFELAGGLRFSWGVAFVDV